MNKYARRTDQAQARLIRDTEARGVQVVDLNAAGKGICDLLLFHNVTAGWVLGEVKNPNSASFRRAQVERKQIKFMSTCRGYVGIVTDDIEAYKLAASPQLYALTQKEKDALAAWLIQNPEAESVVLNVFWRIVGR